MNKTYTAFKRESFLVIFICLTFIRIFFGQTHSRHQGWNFDINFFSDWRTHWLESVAPYDPNGIVRGVFLGEDKYIPKEVQTEFKATGLYHLLAASGFNCWIVALSFAQTVRLFLFWFYFHFPSRFLLKRKQDLALIAEVAGAWIFFLWSDHSPPIARATIMVTNKCFLNLLGIEPGFVRFLSIHYLAFLFAMPSLWGNASFQLTFACLYGMSLTNLIKEHVKIPSFFLSSIGACLGATPVTFLFFGEINFTSVLSNLAAIPLTSAALMPSALVSMLLSVGTHPLSAKLRSVFFIISDWSAHLLLLWVKLFTVLGISIRYVD